MGRVQKKIIIIVLICGTEIICGINFARGKNRINVRKMDISIQNLTN